MEAFENSAQQLSIPPTQSLLASQSLSPFQLPLSCSSHLVVTQELLCEA